MDITETLAPASDQLDAIELAGAPRTFQIEGVSAGSTEQPVNIRLVDFPRAWRPSKSMRRVLAAAWGTDASKYVGRSVTLFCDPNVMFGKDKVGGTRISHMSHIDGPLSVPLLISRGKSATFTVQPLTDLPAPTGPTAEDVAACSDTDALRALWADASPTVRKLITARKAELETAPEPEQGTLA